MEQPDEVYADTCPREGLSLTELDRWNDGTYHCSHCGRSTVVTDGDRFHAPRIVDRNEGLMEALRAEAAKPENARVLAAARERAEAEFLADLDAEALTVEHARAGDRVEVATGTGFLWVTVDYVVADRPGWAMVHYHHDNGLTFSRSLPYSMPITRPASTVRS